MNEFTTCDVKHEYHFDAQKTLDNLVSFIRDWFEKNGPDSKAVIGISGGKDSTVVAGLCCRALGKDRVFGVLMPNGEQKDISDSVRVCKSLGIDYTTINIKDAYDSILKNVNAMMFVKNEGEASEQTKINIAPRLRMTTLYAVSQSIGGRVVNTSNKSEALGGYFTKYGDECGDVFPLLGLTKTEVVEIGKLMTEIPVDLIVKTPSDGLTGMSDEDKLGYTYAEIDALIREGKEGPNAQKILNRIRSTSFKRAPKAVFDPGYHSYM